MPDEVLFDYFCNTKLSNSSDMAKSWAAWLCGLPKQELFVAQVLKRLIYNSVAELRKYTIMAQFDNWPMFLDFSFQEFHFPVDRYEEWEAGKLVASGEVHFDIRFKYNNGGLFSRKTSIDVQLDNNPMPQKIISCVKFDRATTNGERILFYIAAEQTNVQNTALLMLSSMLGYTRDYKYYDSNEPIFASVFTINHNVAKVSFSFGNPDRQIEFY